MTPPRLPSLPEDDPDLDLDTRIDRVEQRLMMRQARLRDRFAAIGERGRAAASSGRVLVPVLAGGTALGLFWWLRRRQPDAADVRRRDPPRRRGHLSSLFWSQVPALALALLTGRGRAGRSMGGGSALAGMLWPLIQRRFGAGEGGRDRGRERDDAPMPVAEVDLQRFAGSWLQVARLPHAGSPAVDGLTTLSFTANGRALQVQRRRLRPGRSAHTEHGVVRIAPRSNGAKLQLSFAPAWLRWLPITWEDHWVLHIEPDYSAALLGNPLRTRLSLLVRRFKGCEGAVNRMLAGARLQGFAVDDLEFASSAAGRPPDATPSQAAHVAAR